ncbi:hypothetical protein HJG60_012294 [Phyllostomus discolor]|uniref:Uncharacterized protein n=1 Tax=Phyllostomus discolor TaxID=89673 RepID=A0A834DPB2_9CHIR|nr:hypothetical protein HJG60_012294 [Phyllostomus discolor]
MGRGRKKPQAAPTARPSFQAHQKHCFAGGRGGARPPPETHGALAPSPPACIGFGARGEQGVPRALGPGWDQLLSLGPRSPDAVFVSAPPGSPPCVRAAAPSQAAPCRHPGATTQVPAMPAATGCVSHRSASPGPEALHMQPAQRSRVLCIDVHSWKPRCRVRGFFFSFSFSFFFFFPPPTQSSAGGSPRRPWKRPPRGCGIRGVWERSPR